MQLMGTGRKRIIPEETARRIEEIKESGGPKTAHHNPETDSSPTQGVLCILCRCRIFQTSLQRRHITCEKRGKAHLPPSVPTLKPKPWGRIELAPPRGSVAPEYWCRWQKPYRV